MKKITIILSIFLVIFVSACSNDSNDELNQNENEKEEETNVNENEEEPENDVGEENEATENEEENDSTKEEPVAEPQYTITENWSIVPIDDRANEQAVLLTIDDAPDEHALEMAETLSELEAPAIFFVNGHFLTTPEEEETLKKIHDLGFIIGNHTYSHANLSELSEEEQKEEIVQVSDMVEEIIGERPKFFRAPFGVYTDFAKEIIREEGMVRMNWTYGYDWENDYMTKDAIADIMVNTELLGNGGNLLMHDREWTAAALHDIVAGLRDKGFEMIDPLLIETLDTTE